MAQPPTICRSPKLWSAEHGRLCEHGLPAGKGGGQAAARPVQVRPAARRLLLRRRLLVLRLSPLALPPTLPHFRPLSSCCCLLALQLPAPCRSSHPPTHPPARPSPRTTEAPWPHSSPSSSCSSSAALQPRMRATAWPSHWWAAPARRRPWHCRRQTLRQCCISLRARQLCCPDSRQQAGGLHQKAWLWQPQQQQRQQRQRQVQAPQQQLHWRQMQARWQRRLGQQQHLPPPPYCMHSSSGSHWWQARCCSSTRGLTCSAPRPG